MTGKQIFGLVGIAAAATIGGMSLLSDVASQSELRPARIPAPCVITDESYDQWMDKCPGGVIPRGNHCMCLTYKSVGEIPEEETEVPEDKKRQFVVCRNDGKWSTRYEEITDPVGTGCHKVVQDMKFPDMTMRNVETDLVTMLREACAPCPVTGSSWGPCPYCLHKDHGKSCEEACPVVEVTP